MGNASRGVDSGLGWTWWNGSEPLEEGTAALGRPPAPTTPVNPCQRELHRPALSCPGDRWRFARSRVTGHSGAVADNFQGIASALVRCSPAFRSFVTAASNGTQNQTIQTKRIELALPAFGCRFHGVDQLGKQAPCAARAEIAIVSRRLDRQLPALQQTKNLNFPYTISVSMDHTRGA